MSLPYTETFQKPSVEVDHEILEDISGRWSPRAFSSEIVREEDLFRLFEAARWAASSMNEQPWYFIYAYNGSESFEKIASTLMEGNKVWAENAPILMLTVVKTTFNKNGASNLSAVHDLGLAVGNLSIQANSMGIGLHQMGGFDRELAREKFNISTEYAVVTAIALGHYGHPEMLEEPFKSRELATRTRKPISEFAFKNEIVKK